MSHVLLLIKALLLAPELLASLLQRYFLFLQQVRVVLQLRAPVLERPQLRRQLLVGFVMLLAQLLQLTLVLTSQRVDRLFVLTLYLTLVLCRFVFQQNQLFTLLHEIHYDVTSRDQIKQARVNDFRITNMDPLFPCIAPSSS